MKKVYGFLAYLVVCVLFVGTLALAFVWKHDRYVPANAEEAVVSVDVEQNINDQPHIEVVEVEKPVVIVEKPQRIFIGEFVLTAYCSCEKCCGKWALNRPKDENGNDIVYGASGEVLVPEYSVAVDPSVIEYGTKIYFGEKEYIAHDCGGAIKGNRIDVYFSDHQKALEFGRQRKDVFVIGIKKEGFGNESEIAY